MTARKIEIRLHDTTIGIWQDDPNDPSFRADIYGGLTLAVLRSEECPHVRS